MEWDVINLKRIEEFENLDYWTLLKISELANRAGEFEDRVKEATEELREEVQSLEDELDSTQSDLNDMDSKIDNFTDLIRECYEKGNPEVKELIEEYDKNHRYEYNNWYWVDKKEQI